MMNLFSLLYPKYEFKKPIKLIQLFAGYGSQALALKYLGVDFIDHKICEWATKSIQAYNDMHMRNYSDYSKNLNFQEIVSELYNYGISLDYNKPMSYNQICKRGESWCRKVYNNIIATHNLVDISKVKGHDLDFGDESDVILTYSYPCQDLSLAGKRQGMSRDSGTRSSLLFEVERILAERERERERLPRVLLMENVSAVIDNNNCYDFYEWQTFLEKLGYQNYVKIINATEFGIPQNRRRCFMISILGEYSYEMPEPMPLTICLKDLLETNFDNKYLLTQKMIDCFLADGTGSFPRRERFLQNVNNHQEMANTITTKAGSRVSDNFILIKNNTKQGYLLAEQGDGIDISARMQYHRGTVQKGMSQTFTTSNNVGVITNDLLIRKLTPRECFRLMGVKDEDFEKLDQADSSLYHLAGDSIVTTVLMALFGELLGIDYKDKIRKVIETWNK